MFRIIRPAFDRGRLRYGTFEDRLGGRLINTSSHPLLDAARVLLGESVDHTIAIGHQAATYEGLTVERRRGGKLAEKGEKIGPRFARWKPFSPSDVEAPLRFSTEPVPDFGERIYGPGA